ncbi:TfoX/Sxy family DNA transformation protein [Hellea balneolensis]|uniref:TfoX/Sxy family DNA transformation protein n=1 Tax=Hellea balneolensis TaxID=287478 RepID=UPI0004285037|nr:TfoX/Sxy family DNA transformation protein [Hellea balneolensis]
MSRKISEMRNLGPACQKWLAAADIHTENQLKALGAVEAYHRANFFAQQRPHLMFLYALEAAILDINLTTLSAEDRARLKRAAKT